MGSHGAATKWGLMDASNEVSYAMRHPGGERICTGAREVTEQLRNYMTSRPDDPELKRVSVYELADDGSPDVGPISLDLPDKP